MRVGLDEAGPAAQSKGRSTCEGFPGALQHRQSAGVLQRQRQREQQHSEKLDRAQPRGNDHHAQKGTEQNRRRKPGLHTGASRYETYA